MKLNKKIFGIFLSLGMMFTFSFCVRAHDQAREEAKQRVEQFIAKVGCAPEKLKVPYETKEKFEEEKRVALAMLEKHSENQKKLIKDVEELFRKAKEAPTNEVFKEIIGFTIDQYNKVLFSVHSSLAVPNLEEEKAAQLKAYENLTKIKIKSLEDLKGKEVLDDKEKEDLIKLEPGLSAIVKEASDAAEMYLEEFKKLNYEDVKIWQEG